MTHRGPPTSKTPEIAILKDVRSEIPATEPTSFKNRRGRPAGLIFRARRCGSVESMQAIMDLPERRSSAKIQTEGELSNVVSGEVHEG